MKNGFLFFALLFSLNAYSAAPDSPYNITRKSWGGFMARVGLGSTFDFEWEKNKGTGLPTEALLKYGIEYGHQFKNTGFYLGGALDWIIVYPRHFTAPKDKDWDFLKPPIALWWIPITNLKVGYAFNDNWLATLGMIYYWGASTSVRYRVSDLLFIEASSIVWLDRVFKAKGAYGEGFDNMDLAFGVGFRF